MEAKSGVGRGWIGLAGIAALVCALGALWATAAQAAVPAGKVAFTDALFDDIWSMNQDGSGIVDLTNTPNSTTNVFEFDPSWSPDGKQILYSRNLGSATNIWIMNADGSNQRPLTTGSVNEGNAVFSPDGTKIAFFSDRSGTSGGQDNEIWVMNADGSNPVRLTTNTDNDNGPDWSPDGTKITFLSSRANGGQPLNRRDVWVMNADGSNPVQLTFTAASGQVNTSPHWSPDGKLLAFSNTAGGDNEIYTMPATGGQATPLTTNDVNDRGPQWTRDGLERLFFVRTDPTDAIFVMNRDGSGLGGPFATGPETFGGSASPAPQPAVSCGGKLATIIGTDSPDSLTGGPGPDVISGQGGNDTISGLDGKDIVCGDAGNDQLNGGKGKDRLYGGKGRDRLAGGKANDKLVGGKGNDRFNGGKGHKNTCIAGGGKKNTAKNCQKEKGF
jgi:Ca2+-binding RTX toxin-like protein